MCLSVDLNYHKIKKEKPIALVAKQTILVYKMIETDGRHLFTPYSYMAINFNDDEYGMFFYKTTRFSFEKHCWDNRYYVMSGIHTFAEIEDAEDSLRFLSTGCGANVKLYNAIIPKGSKFFIGKDGDIASSNLVVFKNKTKYNKNKKYFGDKPIEFSEYLKKFGTELDSK